LASSSLKVVEILEFFYISGNYMRMNRMLKTGLLVLVPCMIVAQPHKCYTDPAAARYLDNPGQRVTYRQAEVAARQWIAANQGSRNTTVVQIPVVFHVVYKNANQNIADSNLVRQVDILNECFRLQNANFPQTRPIFDTIAADVEVEFCLATVDPQGNPTNGITRTSAPAGTFFDPLLGFDNVKADATGGKDPWPSDQYLNIWVCDMSFLGVVVVLGYATFPGGDPLVDGVVIQYNFIGYMPNNTTNGLGRTTVHEVGHWLGLRHIWGDGQLSSPLCDSTDYVDDTPNADTASQQSCMIKNTCSNESPYWTNAGIDPPDMIENYMDYSYDACMTMFTNGQKDRMLGFLNTTRASLLTSPGCGTTGLTHMNNTTVSLYPNPAEDFVEIRVGDDEYFELRFHDLAGRLSLKVHGTGTTRIDVASLPGGICLYELKIDGSQPVAGKMIRII
jgi:hypothetical protein